MAVEHLPVVRDAGSARVPDDSGPHGRLDDRAGAERFDLRGPRAIRPQAADGDDSLAFALGAEYRSERSELQPDAAYQQNDLFGQGAPTLPHRRFDGKKSFGELRVPILQEQTLARTLSFETGYRYSD